jgi:hypothetical protein
MGSFVNTESQIVETNYHPMRISMLEIDWPYIDVISRGNFVDIYSNVLWLTSLLSG